MANSSETENEPKTIRVLTFNILSSDRADWERRREAARTGLRRCDPTSSRCKRQRLVSGCLGGEARVRCWPHVLTVNPLVRAGEMPLELGRRTDYIMIRNGIHGPTLDVADCRRVLNKAVAGVWASDHSDVIADLEIPTHLPGTWEDGRARYISTGPGHG